MKQKLIKAKFIGANGSLGYETNKTYNLLIKGTIIVREVDLMGRCEYSSIEAFLDNWIIIEQY